MSPRTRRILKVSLAGLFMTMGVLHFAVPSPFVQIMPPQLPYPLLLVYLSGVAEFASGALLLSSRRSATSARPSSRFGP